MNELEHSVRKLVREEAASAATETVTTLQKEVHDTLGAMRSDIRTIAADELKISSQRLATWARHNVPRPEGIAERPSEGLTATAVVEWRLKAIELAQVVEGAGASAEDILASGERFARFLIDGCLDGQRRPIVDLPAGDE